MKHIKRVKSAVTTMLFTEGLNQRIPIVAVYMKPPQSMAISSWDEEGNGNIPRYEIFDISPVDKNPKNVMVNVSFIELLEDDDPDKPLQYMVTIPIHLVVTSHAFSIANDGVDMAVFPTEFFDSDSSKTPSLQDVLIMINFPDKGNEIYARLAQQLSLLVAAPFSETLYPESTVNGSHEASGMNSIPTPLRRSQMAMMPLISAMAADDTKALQRVVDMEDIFDNFHLRNHNENNDNPEIGEYRKVLETIQSSENYVAPEIPEDLVYASTMEYSILDNMTDAMEEHLRSTKDVNSRMFYQDISLLVLLSNVKNLYEKSESDGFLTELPIVNQEREMKFNPETHRSFMELAKDQLNGIFDEVENVSLTEEEKTRAENVTLWHKSPDEFWPTQLSKLKDAVIALPNHEAYFEIMKQSYTTADEMNALIAKYGLGKVFTSLLLKSSINLCKFAEIANAKKEHAQPLSIVAMRWITHPEDGYRWELPAMSYALANYDVETFVSMMTFIEGNTANYGSLTLHGLAMQLIREDWERETLEYLLVEHTGMPAKYRDLLLILVDEIQNVEVDDEDASEISNEHEYNTYVAIKAIHEVVVKHETSINEAAHMMAYAIPALADIHVNTIPELFDDENNIDENVSDENVKINMGSVEWKRHRVAYIESVLDSIASVVERKTI